MTGRRMPLEGDDMEMIALAEILNAANAAELPDPRAINILKKNATIARIKIEPRQTQRPEPPSARAERDFQIAASVEMGLKPKHRDEGVIAVRYENKADVVLSGKQVLNIHKKQMKESPQQVKKRAWFRSFRYHIKRYGAGKK